MSLGYNPYRKANGEFAKKDEVGATLERDLESAYLAGDKGRIDEIENVAMTQFADTAIGQKVLKNRYAEGESRLKKNDDGPVLKPPFQSKLKVRDRIDMGDGVMRVTAVQDTPDGGYDVTAFPVKA